MGDLEALTLVLLAVVFALVFQGCAVVVDSPEYFASCGRKLQPQYLERITQHDKDQLQNVLKGAR